MWSIFVPIIHITIPTFDWGGFLGGSLGAVGAYIAARVTIRWDRNKEKPKFYRKSYETAVEMQLKIASLHVVLQNQHETTIFELMDALQKFSKGFGPILSDAIENNTALAEIGFYLYAEMDKALEQPFAMGSAIEWQRKETMSEAILIIKEFDKAILKALSDIRTVIDEIRSKYNKRT